MSTTDNKMEIDNPTKEKAIKTAVNDISTDLASVSKDVQSLSDQLPALVATRSEINSFKNQTEKYDTRLADAAAVIEKGVSVRVDPAKLSGEHVKMLEDLKTMLDSWNKRWEKICKAIASTSKIKVYLTVIMSSVLSVLITLMVCYNSSYIWAHRALVAAEESHMENPLDEYSKAFVEMREGWKSRKDCKDRIEGMESDARYIKKLEGVLSDYTEEELEVRKHKVNIKDEQMARLVCYHPSTEQMVNYRMHTTPDGIVTKVEVEKKVKGKNVWVELKELSSE